MCNNKSEETAGKHPNHNNCDVRLLYMDIIAWRNIKTLHLSIMGEIMFMNIFCILVKLLTPNGQILKTTGLSSFYSVYKLQCNYELSVSNDRRNVSAS